MSRRRIALTLLAGRVPYAPCGRPRPGRRPLLSPAVSPDFLERLAYIAPVLLFAMVAHEYAHGYAAMKQGDMTAYQLGRLTWNPIKHIDPMMTVVVPLITILSSGVAFGGAKPVPVQPRNYRNYKRGDIIVSLAGVATNLVIAVASAILIALLGAVGSALPALTPTLVILQRMLDVSIVINLVLVAFNLIPLPPLDGSHVFKYLLPPAWSLSYQRLGAYGFILLFLLITVGRPLLAIWMGPAIGFAGVLRGLVAPFVVAAA
jgi:Zn-dependent protease